MSRAPQLEWVKPPRQARSQETLERLLAATEELLLEQPFESISITEIARRARSSVGAFYARFPDKEALSRCVLERFHAEAVATARESLAPARWRDATASEFIETTLRFLIRVFRERRHFVTALRERAARDEGLAAMGEQIGELVASELLALLDERGQRVGHREPSAAVRLCVWLIMSAFETRAVFAPRPQHSESALTSEIAAMCLSYLRIEDVEQTGPERLVS